MIQLTPEQFNVKEYVINTNSIVLVAAKGGTGKSFMARHLVKVLEPKKVLYTAFNKAIVKEQEGIFPSNVECKTLHALAYKYTQPKEDIHPLDYKDFPKGLSYKSKYEVKEALEEFFVSNSTDMYEYFSEYFKDKKLTDASVYLVNSMLEKKLPWSFSFMLKYFHLMLIENPSICKYDLVLLDEINDTTAVALEIFKLIEAPKKVGLGDPYQAIYAFLNLSNGFEELKNVPILPLTNSFRCSKEIASSIQELMRKELDDTFTFTGTDEPVKNGLELYCTLTNAEIIQELSNRLDNKKPFKLLRKPADIFACVLALSSANQGKKVYQKAYRFLEDVYEDWINYKKKKPNITFFGYIIKELTDPEIHSAIRLLSKLKNDGHNLFELYGRVKAYKQNGNYTISTTFTSKGLEFETVYISEGLNNAVQKVIDSKEAQSEEDKTTMKIYYVACSRAGRVLKNAKHLRL